MAITALTVIQKAYELWHKPANTRLPVESVVSALNRITADIFAEMQLTSLNYFAAVSSAFTVSDSTRKRLITEPVSTVVRVESRPSGSSSEDDWEEELLWDYGDWNNAGNKPMNAVSVYGNTDAMYLVVNRDPTDREFRMIYETEGDLEGIIADGIDADINGLPVLFQFLFEYALALECGELIEDDSEEFRKRKKDKMVYLSVKTQQAYESLDKWLKNRKPQSVTTREAFNIRRNNGLNRKDSGRGFTF